MCGFGNQRMVGVFSLSLSICAASNENDAFVCNACPELVRVHRFRRPRAFVNFVIFWIIHKMIRWYLSLFIVNSLSFFLPSHLQNNRSSKVASFSKTVVSAPIVWYVSNACSLFYFTRSFVRSSSFGSKFFQTKFPKEEEDKNYSLCSFSFFLRKTVQIERVFATREQSESVADQLFLCICLLSLAPLFTQTAKETSSNKNPANPSPPPRCRRWKSPKSPTPPRKSGTSPPLCSVAPSSVWRSVSCYWELNPPSKARIKRKREYFVYL